ncbi:MAG: alanine dehydrogenase [Thiohalobacteraceae bacterium]
MRIGVPKEIKPREGRVALIPAACADLVRAGHEVFIEAGSGLQSGFSDASYVAFGAVVQPDAERLYAAADLIVKVKEPIADDLRWLGARHTLFCYLHLAANRVLTEQLLAIGLTAIAFETVEHQGGLPLLAPMSDIAGRLAVQIGAHLLHQPQGGKGLLLGGLAGVERGKVTVIGAGKAGSSAAAMAASVGAEVKVFDKSQERLEAMRALAPNITALYPYVDALDQAIQEADLLIGAVLIPGAKAIHVVSAAQVRKMTPGSVIVDVSVDQGGCIETTRPTSYTDPTFSVDGVVHFCVTNMPGAVPRSASHALSTALLPYVRRLAGEADWHDDAALARGVNVEAGQLIHPAVRAAFA